MPPEDLNSLISRAARLLAEAGCETSALDARLLLQAATGLSREAMILDPQCLLAQDQLRHFAAMVERRAAHEPVARILGEREFYGRRFQVTPATLDPRPDTETLITAALDLLPREGRILDLGTGSGAIAITLLAERPDAAGLATDVSAPALEVARANAMRHAVEGRLGLAEGSWFSAVAGRFDIILSNPPYIPASEIAGLSLDVRGFDPILALDGGLDGLDAYRIIAGSSASHLTAQGHVLVEIGSGQGSDVEAIFTGAGFRPAGRHKDLGGHLRCLVFQPEQK